MSTNEITIRGLTPGEAYVFAARLALFVREARRDGGAARVSDGLYKNSQPRLGGPESYWRCREWWQICVH